MTPPSFEKGHDTDRSSSGGSLFSQSMKKDSAFESSPPEKREKEARDIAEQHHGDYDAIIRELSAKNLLPQEIKRIRSNYEYQKYLEKATSFLSAQEWEMLTVLELFDVETFEHCLRTYEKAREMIESEGALGCYLRENIIGELKETIPEKLSAREQEEVFQTVYQACLFHDLGKIAVPKFILNNTLRNDEWIRLGEQFCTHNTIECYQQKITDSKGTLRAKDAVPVRVGLTEGQVIQLQNLGIDPEQPLGSIVNTHAAHSAKLIREKTGNVRAASIVEDHHSKKPIDERKYPLSSSTVGIASTFSSILHATDVFDAIRSVRSYKGNGGIFETLAVLVEEKEKGLLDPTHLSLVIEYEFERFQTKTTSEGRRLSQSLRRYFAELKEEKDGSSLVERELEAFKKVRTFYKETNLLREKAHQRYSL